SAGAHCPVIRALLGCEKALAVTEPTAFGEHDLAVISKLLKKVGVPYSVVLNRSTISKKIVPGVVLNIPYDEKMIECYVGGVPIVLKYPEHKISRDIFKFAKELLK
ncbi:MAG: cobalamin biosynthesis protein CobQ, partial [Candidatus Micrarchaeota archaeon]